MEAEEVKMWSSYLAPADAEYPTLSSQMLEETIEARFIDGWSNIPMLDWPEQDVFADPVPQMARTKKRKYDCFDDLLDPIGDCFAVPETFNSFAPEAQEYNHGLGTLSNWSTHAPLAAPRAIARPKPKLVVPMRAFDRMADQLDPDWQRASYLAKKEGKGDCDAIDCLRVYSRLTRRPLLKITPVGADADASRPELQQLATPPPSPSSLPSPLPGPVNRRRVSYWQQRFHVAAANNNSSSQGKRDEAGAPALLQTMESATMLQEPAPLHPAAFAPPPMTSLMSPGPDGLPDLQPHSRPHSQSPPPPAIATPDTPHEGHAIPSSDREQHQQHDMSPTAAPASATMALTGALADAQPSVPATPAHIADHGMLSNLRGAMSEPDAAIPFAPFMDIQDPRDTPNIQSPDHQAIDDQSIQDHGLLASDSSEAGFAKLNLPDCFHVMQVPNLVIVRDTDYLRRWQEAKKEQKREDRKRQALALQAQQAQDAYAKEPSQPSQFGDDPAPASASAENDSLEGRPAASKMSAFSEQGGAVAYEPFSDDELSRSRKRRRIKANSSSATSIAPQDLHQTDYESLGAQPYLGVPESENPGDWAQLPVHPGNPDEIKTISREHLIISYNISEQHWNLHVIGNGAYVDNTFYSRGTRDVPLRNGSEIYISSLRIEFVLPDPPGPALSDIEMQDSEDEQEAHALATSPAARRLSSAMADLSDDNGADREEDEENERPAKKKRKIILKTGPKKPSQKEPKGAAAPSGGKEKPAKSAAKKKAKEAKASTQPDAEEKPGKGKTTATDAAQATAEAKPPGSQIEATVAQTSLPDNSPFAGLAPGEMPEKRKGPGRPPKNGVVSKRDGAAVTRKQKQYAERGEEEPPYNVLLDLVRREQKQKDEMNRALKGTGSGPTDAVASIETDNIKSESHPAGNSHTHEAEGHNSRSPVNAQEATSSVLRQQIPQQRPPTPIKPKEQFTEEELKKPTQTYVYILDEVLRELGEAELQTIYDKVQKRYPYYKYGVTTNGWQSSIRHNLVQCDRFKESGKAGKGKLWKIDFEVPLDQKKGRRSPPPRPQGPMPMPNGQPTNGVPAPQHSYGQPQYAPQYIQPPVNGHPSYNPSLQGGQGHYNSPYAASHLGQHPPNGPPGTVHANPNTQAPNGAHPPQQNAQQPQGAAGQNQRSPEFGAIVDEIMKFHSVYLPRFQGTPGYQQEYDKFFGGVNYFSNVYHQAPNAPPVPPPPYDLNEEPLRTMGEIFARHTAAQRNAQAAAAANTGVGAAPAHVPATGQPQNAANGSAHAQGNGHAAPVQVQAAQPAVQNGTNDSESSQVNGQTAVAQAVVAGTSSVTNSAENNPTNVQTGLVQIMAAGSDTAGAQDGPSAHPAISDDAQDVKAEQGSTEQSDPMQGVESAQQVPEGQVEGQQ